MDMQDTTGDDIHFESAAHYIRSLNQWLKRADDQLGKRFASEGMISDGLLTDVGFYKSYCEENIKFINLKSIVPDCSIPYLTVFRGREGILVFAIAESEEQVNSLIEDETTSGFEKLKQVRLRPDLLSPNVNSLLVHIETSFIAVVSKLEQLETRKAAFQHVVQLNGMLKEFLQKEGN